MRRYMDDILLVYADNSRWDHESFCADITRSTCYVPPLTLTEGKLDTFLETRFAVDTNGDLRFWLKNENEGGCNTVWRYQHFHSYAPHTQKRAVLTSCLQKVHKMASDTAVLYRSACHKVAEFVKLSYPRYMLRAACTYMAASHGERTWLDVRDQF